jgi:pyruvate/2-oxoglutarate dehydrogenase complex dihydrolipoamide dehydrogenase (E3) component
MQRYDLIAIGGGTAGLVTAAGAAALGLRVALVERAALGGDCLWTGCVPSKALIASARLAHRMRHADRLGLVGAAPHHVFATVMERMRAARQRVAVHDDPERFRRMGVDVVFGGAALRAPDQVAVGERLLSAKRVVIATGARAAVPPVPGLEQAGSLTYETAFDRTALPSRIAILGGGPIGLEFAQIYRRLGAEVTVIEMLPQLLPREESEAGGLIRRRLEQEGVRVLCPATVERVVAGDGGTTVIARDGVGAGLRLPTDEVFVATGRRPNTAGLGLEAVGVALDGDTVRVDRALRTTAKGVWAAGDVTGGPQFTHVADYHAKLVLRNAIFPFHKQTDYRAIPMVTYTDPEVARVGLTEEEARQRHGAVEVYSYELADLDRAIVDDDDVGFVKVVTTKRGKIVGATIVARHAGELLQSLVLAIAHRIPLPKLAQVVYPYPTMVEGVKRTADGYYRRWLQGPKGAWLERIAGWLT